MCGIAGEYCLGATRVDEDAITKMMNSIRHRGPDGWGVYTSPDMRVGLYHVRLSIVDVAAGKQPICNEDGTVWVSFNGEIYDYQALRQDLKKKGHRFRTRTDTEVIVHLYEEYGEEFVNKLRGEFAISLYDQRNDALYLVRDRFGVKPLYFARTPSQIIFGSEIKALFAHGAVGPAFDHEAIYSYLSLLPMGNRTVFEGIEQVEPGTMMRVRRGDITVRRYWDLSFLPAEEERRVLSPRQEAGLIDEFRDLLDDSIRTRLVADVDVGVYLSGGLDSSAVAAGIHAASSNLKSAFTIAFGDAAYDESSMARSVADHLGLESHVVHVDRGDLTSHFAKSIWHAEIPVPMSSGTAKYLLSRLASQHVKVVLTGEGADELLCGYAQFKHHQQLHLQHTNAGDATTRKRVEQFARGISGEPTVLKVKRYNEVDRINELFHNLPYPAQRPWHFGKGARLLQSKAAGRATKQQDTLGLVARSMDVERLRGIDHLAATQYFLYKTDLPHLLLNWLGDREEMAHGIEGRTPFLDHKLVEFGTRLPSSLKLRGDTEKYILRAATEARLPQVIRETRKKMFQAPTLDTLNILGTDEFRGLMSRKQIAEAGVFSPNVVSMIKVMSGLTKPGSAKYKHYEGALTYVLSFQLLHEMFIKNREQYSQMFQLPHGVSNDWTHHRVSAPAA